jgi:hypothetical protein
VQVPDTLLYPSLHSLSALSITQVFLMHEASMISRDVLFIDTDVLMRADVRGRLAHSAARIVGNCECIFPPGP